MSATFVVYIDESGDEGFAFERGSSEWFVLSAVIVRESDDLSTVKLVDRIRNQLGNPPRSSLHFRDLKHEQRLPYIAEIAQAALSTATVLVYKPLLKEPEKFQERYRLYFYTVRYLLERVSWYWRDHSTRHDSGDGSAEIIFSNKSHISYHELKTYLRSLEEGTSLFDVRIDWNVIKPKQIKAYPADSRMGLQIADAVASGFYWAVRKQHGFTECRYARMLKPVVYHWEGRWLGYGLKFWPKEVDTLLESGDCFEWVKDTYK